MLVLAEDFVTLKQSLIGHSVYMMNTTLITRRQHSFSAKQHDFILYVPTSVEMYMDVSHVLVCDCVSSILVNKKIM